MATTKEEKKGVKKPQDVAQQAPPTDEERQRAIIALVGQLREDNAKMQKALMDKSKEEKMGLLQSKLSWLWSIIMASSEENTRMGVPFTEQFKESVYGHFEELIGELLKVE